MVLQTYQVMIPITLVLERGPEARNGEGNQENGLNNNKGIEIESQEKGKGKTLKIYFLFYANMSL